MTTNLNEKVMKIVAKVTGGKLRVINPEGDLRTELALDSIQVVEFFALLEKEFDVELPLQLMTVKTGKEFIGILEDSLKQKGVSATV
jgi:acyl carrier protein